MFNYDMFVLNQPEIVSHVLRLNADNIMEIYFNIENVNGVKRGALTC